MRISKKESKNKKKEKLTGTIKDYALVEVKWNDATGESGWMDINKAMLSKTAKPVSLGYLLETKEKIIIFTDYIVDDEDGTLTVGNVTTIFINFKMSRRFILRTNMAITIEVRNNNVEKL